MGRFLTPTTLAPAAADGLPDDRGWFGHPRGLTILFLTETWSQFSYYGMRALLVYYMTKQLLFAQGQASMVYGLYTAFTYFTPILGGAISDRWLGRKRAVIWGSLIMALGHFLMAFEPLLYLALATIAIGNGLFLPSLPSQVSSLYRDGDPRRGSAFNVYYVGINLGAFLAPLGCGTIGELYGWHWGFMLAGVGMMLGLVIYLAGSRHLPPEPVRAPKTAIAAKSAWSRGDRQTLLLLLGIGLVVSVFRGAYEQIGNTVALFTDEHINRSVTEAFAIPATWFQSLNPMLVFLLTPGLVARWTRQAKAGREPAPLRKMSYGAITVAAAYLMLAAVASVTGGVAAGASWIWMALFVALLTIGELFILPIGLGLFARLAPPAFAATTIAAWFFAAFTGNLLAGALGTLWTGLGPPMFFVLMAVTAGCSAALLFLLDRPAQAVEARASLR